VVQAVPRTEKWVSSAIFKKYLQFVLAAKILIVDFVVCTLAEKKNQGRFRHVGSDHSLVREKNIQPQRKLSRIKKNIYVNKFYVSKLQFSRPHTTPHQSDPQIQQWKAPHWSRNSIVEYPTLAWRYIIYTLIYHFHKQTQFWTMTFTAYQWILCTITYAFKCNVFVWEHWLISGAFACGSFEDLVKHLPG
jgi:hypothetical protein